MKPKTLRISRGGGEDGGRCHGNQEKGGAEVGGGRDAAEERPGELAALRAARALSHRGGRPQKRGGTRCGGSRAQASPNRGGSPFLAGSGMESLLPRGLKAPTGRLPVRWPPGLGTAASGCACLKGAAGEATVLESSPRVVGSHWRDGRGQSQSRNTSGPGAARGRISSLGTRAVGGTARVRVPGSRERDEQSFDPALRPSLSQPEPDPQLLPELPRCSAGPTRSGRGRSPGRSEGPPEKSSQPADLTRRLLLKN
ncbi:translation initiation factor IF-2-like isoform X2 [Monodelphis domestica]|uniref:translation initiation factor IF-2-like isoform X2 n=1 Tax=Monodelphis domestica TaxID=13616 RepID=UPI0024E22ACA|nr:translation initiation factor IF-2-like isoform X2 [Monodelphis domestica]